MERSERTRLNAIVKKLLPYIVNERELITKLIEFEEKGDIESFTAIQKVYKESKKLTDTIISQLYEEADFDTIMEYLSNKIKKMNSKQKSPFDIITILGIIRNIEMNKIAEEEENIPSDLFSSELSLTIYEIYLWYVSNHELSQEFRQVFRNDMMIKATDSRVLRHYFSGDYETVAQISDPYNYYAPLERIKADVTYASMMIEYIGLANNAPSFVNMFDELSYKTRQRMLEIEFAAVSAILAKRGTLIPPNNIPYTPYTEEIIRNASLLFDEFRNRDETPDKGPRKIFQEKKPD